MFVEGISFYHIVVESEETPIQSTALGMQLNGGELTKHL